MNRDDRSRAAAMDTVLAVSLLLVSLFSVLALKQEPDPAITPLGPFAYVLIAGQTLPLIWRRRFPTYVLAVIVLCFMIARGIDYPTSWALFGMSLGVYTVGSQLPPKQSLLVGSVAIDVVLLWTVVGVLIYDVQVLSLVAEVAVLGLPLLIGRETYRRQQRLIDLEKRAIAAEHEREQRAVEAVTRERVRIARELHDVVAHEITVMTIQSAAARRVLARDAEQADTAIKAAEEAGHRALTEVRRLLGMLRTTDPRVADPQTGLDALDRLVDQMNSAGLTATLTVNGEVRNLPLGIDINAYRIIQESLTNTLKHGGPNVNVHVAITYDHDLLRIEVSDDGRGAAAERAGNGAPGQGLVGMHERASLLGGALHAGPRPGGGYRVTARIPIPSP
ncbi:MAG: sensor histidine kinase [Acidimicrobiia bacterium]